MSMPKTHPIELKKDMASQGKRKENKRKVKKKVRIMNNFAEAGGC